MFGRHLILTYQTSSQKQMPQQSPFFLVDTCGPLKMTPKDVMMAKPTPHISPCLDATIHSLLAMMEAV